MSSPVQVSPSLYLLLFQVHRVCRALPTFIFHAFLETFSVNLSRPGRRHDLLSLPFYAVMNRWDTPTVQTDADGMHLFSFAMSFATHDMTVDFLQRRYSQYSFHEINTW